MKEFGDPDITGGDTQAANLMGQGASQLGFTGAGGADDVLVVGHPMTGSQALENGGLQSAFVSVIDLFRTSRFPGAWRSSGAISDNGPRRDPLPVDEQTEALMTSFQLWLPWK